VNYILKEKHASLDFDKFYLCGPEEMINTVSDALKEKNIKESDIKFELFSSSTKENTIEQSLEGHAQITVMVDDEETTFEMSAKHTILDAALKQGIDAPYSCQGGICSSCLARVTEGTAEMTKNSILSEKEVADGLILTCQAHPTSATIRVDFDDV
jgi:ring-1,2-phenylacetyl-CoA epoxidase subunit PaaE